MLIKCPECDLQVSDKALTCPHCGYPLKKGSAKNPTREKSRGRLPNGFGRITKLSKKTKNPYRVIVTVGKDANGKPIGKLLKPKAYFATYNEAYAALVDYNKNPYDLDQNMTVAELYEKWSEEYFKTLKNPSSARTIKVAWKHCHPLYSMDVRAIRARHIKGCIESANASAGIKARIKSLFNIMLDYALEYEIVDKNYARDFALSSNISTEIEANRIEHVAFTDEELNILWKNTRNRTVRMILIQCYMGWRPQEVCLLEKKNIEGDFITGGMKTDAGKDRRVPIHSCIKSLIVPEGNKLFENMTYDRYKRDFDSCMELLGIHKHRPHDGRKTFVTLAKKYDVDEYAIKRMVGHAITDITEKIYTERNDDWFIEEIEKIKGPAM